MEDRAVSAAAFAASSSFPSSSSSSSALSLMGSVWKLDDRAILLRERDEKRRKAKIVALEKVLIAVERNFAS